MHTMTVELAMAALLIVLGLLQLVLTAIEYRRVYGVHYANTARDVAPDRPESKLLGRLRRAQANLMETAPYFIGLAIVIALTGLSTPATRGAAVVFVLCRIVYLPLYAFGVPYLRGLVWTISFVALGVMAYGVVAAVPWPTVMAVLS